MPNCYRKRTTKKLHLENRETYGEGDVDSKIEAEGWRKMEAAAQNRAEYGEEWSVTACVPPNESNEAEVSKCIETSSA